MRLFSLIFLLACTASAQVADGIVTLVSRNVNIAPDEADFVAVASTSLDTTQDAVAQVFHDAGIQNLTVTNVAAGINNSTYPPPTDSQLFYQIAFTTAPSALAGYTKKLDGMRAAPPAALTSLQYSAVLNASQTAVDAAHQATLPQLLTDARARAQLLATAANLKLGAIAGVSESNNSVGNTIPYAIVSGVLGSFSSGPSTSTQYTFYATVKFAVQ